MRGGVVLGVILMCMAAACMGVAQLAPDTTVLRWMQAFAAQDGETVARLTCRAGQSDNQNSRLMSMALGVPVGANYGGGGGGQFLYGGGGGQASYDVTGLKYATTFADGARARVQVTGVLRMTSGLASQTLTMNTTVELAREQDQWRVCDTTSPA